jgi:hypothetical protein
MFTTTIWIIPEDMKLYEKLNDTLFIAEDRWYSGRSWRTTTPTPTINECK